MSSAKPDALLNGSTIHGGRDSPSLIPVTTGLPQFAPMKRNPWRGIGIYGSRLRNPGIANAFERRLHGS